MHDRADLYIYVRKLNRLIDENFVFGLYIFIFAVFSVRSNNNNNNIRVFKFIIFCSKCQNEFLSFIGSFFILDHFHVFFSLSLSILHSYISRLNPHFNSHLFFFSRFFEKKNCEFECKHNNI